MRWNNEITKNAHFIGIFIAWQLLPGLLFSHFETLFSYYETILHMDITFVFTVAVAATLIVVALVLVAIIIYQRWRIGDQNVFIERFIRQNEEMRQKMRKAGIV